MNQKSARKLLEQNGWVEKRGGKHVVKMTKEGQRPITLPMHKGQDYSRGLELAIMKQAGLKEGPSMASVELTARIHREDGSYWAEVVELPGCFASGDTLDELAEALSEAISLYTTDSPDAGAIANPEAVHQVFKVDEMKMLVPAS